MPTTTLHCPLHESGALHGRVHISGTHHLDQTNIKEEANIRGMEHVYNINAATNIHKHDNNRWDLGSTKQGADREWKGVLAEDARVH